MCHTLRHSSQVRDEGCELATPEMVPDDGAFSLEEQDAWAAEMQEEADLLLRDLDFFKRKLRVDRIVPLHGAIGTMAEFRKAVAGTNSGK